MEKQNSGTRPPDLPLPVLTGQTPTMSGPREWKQAPSGVRDARIVDMLGTFLLAAGTVGMVLEGDRLVAIAVATLYAGICLLLIWLVRSLKRGVPTAWNAQILFSIFGLLGFPLGTLLHGLILSKWFRPEKKAWFGRS